MMITTLWKPDETNTETMTEKILLMLDRLIPEDKHKVDTTFHKTIQEKIKQPLYTTEDMELKNEEV